MQGGSISSAIRGGGSNKIDKSVSYTTNSYPETDKDDEKLGITIKGASEEVKIAHAKIALLLGRKGEEIKLENIKLNIVDTPYEKGCVKALIEITSYEIANGKAVL